MCLFDFFKNNVCFIFLSLKRQIFRCGKVVLEYKKNIFKMLLSLLLVVRSGDEVEKIFMDVFDKVVLFFFYQIYFLLWISGKEKEVRMLFVYLEYLKDIQFVLLLEDFDSVVDLLEYDWVFCFFLLIVSN